MKSKVIVQGRWVLGYKDQWRLTIDPYVEVYATKNNKLVPASAFLLADLDRLEGERKFNINNVTLDDIEGRTERLTIFNMGDLSNVHGYDYEMFLLLEPTDLSVSNNIVFEAYVDDIVLDEDDEPLDLEIMRRLKTLTAPMSVTCTQRSHGGNYVPSTQGN